MVALELRLSAGSKACDFAGRNYTRHSRALAERRRVAWCSLCAGEHSAHDEAAAVRATPSHHDDEVAGNPFATEWNYPVLRSYCRVAVATQGLLF
jgi:hypothetical protein